MQTANALERLSGCAGSPELLLVAYMVSTKISRTGLVCSYFVLASLASGFRFSLAKAISDHVSASRLGECLFLSLHCHISPKAGLLVTWLHLFIGMTVGIPLTEFNEVKDLEFMTFRRNILQVCKESDEHRKQSGKHSLALYTYPPDVESSAKLPEHLEEKLQKPGMQYRKNRKNIWTLEKNCCTVKILKFWTHENLL